MSKDHNIFSTSGCLPLDTIIKYINEELSKKEMHTVEKHMMECELCHEAIEGYSLIKNKKGLPGKIFDLNQKIVNEQTPFNYQRIAASIAAVAVLASGLFYLNNQIDSSDQLIGNKNSTKDTTIVQAPNNQSSTQDKSIAVEDNLKKKQNGFVGEEQIQSDALIITKPEAVISHRSTENRSEIEDLESKTNLPVISADPTIKESELNGNTRSMPVPDIAPKAYKLETAEESKNLERSQKGDNRKAKKKSPSTYSGVSSNDDLKKESVTSQHFNLQKLEEGIEKYTQKKYKEASVVFELILQSEPLNSDALYYNGLSNYELELWDLAIKSFGKVDKKSSYYQESRWKKIQALMKKGDKETAKILLKEISQENGPYKNKAIEELKQL
jgi:hypothetical protein